MNRYRCEMAELHAGQAGKQAMTELLLRHQTPAERTSAKKSRHPLRTALLAAAVTALLATAALALSPTLRDALASALGGFAPYAQDLTDQELTCTDQGIQLKVVSALADGNVYRVYFTLQDLEGDRLDEFTFPDLSIGISEGESHFGIESHSNGVLVSYDPETRTGLFYSEMFGEGEPAQFERLRLKGSVIKPGRRVGQTEVDLAWMAQNTLKTQMLSDGRKVLIPEQNPCEIANHVCDLSAFGFDDDGVLHLQFRLKVPVADWGCSYMRWFVASRTSETDGKLGWERTERYNKGEGVHFVQDGVSYCDVLTGVTSDDMDDMIAPYPAGICLQTKDIIRGEWSVEFPVKALLARKIDMAQSTTLSGVTASKLYLTQMGASLESDSNGTGSTLPYILTVYFADGLSVSAGKADSGYHTGSYATNHWTFGQPIDPETVTAIALGLWYVPIEDGVAQSGHWLAEQP